MDGGGGESLSGEVPRAESPPSTPFATILSIKGGHEYVSESEDVLRSHGSGRTSYVSVNGAYCGEAMV